jgi:pycsar effector protein
LAELTENIELIGNRKAKAMEADKHRYTALTAAASNCRQLIVQVDNKAHLLVQVNAVMISVLLTFALGMPQQHRLVILPIGAQLVTCLIVVSLAVTRPKLRGLPPSVSGQSGSPGNLLFFGIYAGMELENYIREMEYMFGDSDYICDNLIREIFHQALILGKKYKFIRLAYTGFLLGTGVSITISGIIAFL